MPRLSTMGRRSFIGIALTLVLAACGSTSVELSAGLTQPVASVATSANRTAVAAMQPSEAEIPHWYSPPQAVEIVSVSAESGSVVATGSYRGDVQPLCADFAAQAAAAGFDAQPPLACTDGFAVVDAFEVRDNGDAVVATLALTRGEFVIAFPCDPGD